MVTVDAYYSQPSFRIQTPKCVYQRSVHRVLFRRILRNRGSSQFARAVTVALNKGLRKMFIKAVKNLIVGHLCGAGFPMWRRRVIAVRSPPHLRPIKGECVQ